MRKLASDIRSLELRIAKLEKIKDKASYVSKLKDKIADAYVAFKRKVPGKSEVRSMVKGVLSNLESDINSYSYSSMESTISLKGESVFFNIVFETSSGIKELNFSLRDREDILSVRELNLKETNSANVRPLRHIRAVIHRHLYYSNPLFWGLLKGDLTTLIDDLDSKTRKEFEQKFWKDLERKSSVAAKILKIIAAVGMGGLLVKLVMAVFGLSFWNLIGWSVFGLLITTLGALATAMWEQIGQANKRASRKDKKKLESFLFDLSWYGLEALLGI